MNCFAVGGEHSSTKVDPNESKDEGAYLAERSTPSRYEPYRSVCPEVPANHENSNLVFGGEDGCSLKVLGENLDCFGVKVQEWKGKKYLVCNDISESSFVRAIRVADHHSIGSASHSRAADIRIRGDLWLQTGFVGTWSKGNRWFKVSAPNGCATTEVQGDNIICVNGDERRALDLPEDSVLFYFSKGQQRWRPVYRGLCPNPSYDGANHTLHCANERVIALQHQGEAPPISYDADGVGSWYNDNNQWIGGDYGYGGSVVRMYNGSWAIYEWRLLN